MKRNRREEIKEKALKGRIKRKTGRGQRKRDVVNLIEVDDSGIEKRGRRGRETQVR